MIADSDVKYTGFIILFSLLLYMFEIFYNKYNIYVAIKFKTLSDNRLWFRK